MLQAILEVFIYFSKQFHKVSIEVAEHVFKAPGRYCFSVRALVCYQRYFSGGENPLSHNLKFQYIHENVPKHEAEHRNKLMFQSFWCLHLKDMTTQHLCYLFFALSNRRFTQKEWNVCRRSSTENIHQTASQRLWFDEFYIALKCEGATFKRDAKYHHVLFPQFFQWNKEKFIPRT